MKKWGRHLETLDPEAHHHIRIEAKKLRYASEFFARLVSSKTSRKRHKRILKALERLQAHLGTLNDIRTWHELAARHATKPQGTVPAGARQAAAGQAAAAAPDHVFAAGYISGRLDGESAKLLSAAMSAHRQLVDIKPILALTRRSPGRPADLDQGETIGNRRRDIRLTIVYATRTNSAESNTKLPTMLVVR